MKKIIYSFLLIMILLLTACSDNESVTLEATVDNICGTWTQEADQTVLGKDSEAEVLPLIITMEFNEDLTCSILFETPSNKYGIEDRRQGCKYQLEKTDEKTIMTIYYTETDKDEFEVTVTKDTLLLDGRGLDYNLKREK